MSKVILLPLVLLILACVLNVAYNADLTNRWNQTSLSYDQSYGHGTFGGESGVTVDGGSVVGNVLSVSLGGSMMIILVCGVGIAIGGLQVFGSGLSSTSVLIIFKIISWMTIWGFFSAPAIGLFMTIWWCGLPLYFLLSFFFVAGVVGQIGQ